MPIEPNEQTKIALDVMHNAQTAAEAFLVTYYVSPLQTDIHFERAVESIRRINAVLAAHGISTIRKDKDNEL